MGDDAVILEGVDSPEARASLYSTVRGAALTCNACCRSYRHINIQGTQRYLTLTPELLRAASDRFERYAMGPIHE